MDPLKVQLEALRARIKQIDQRYEEPPRPETRALPEGYEVTSELGTHWQVDQLWPAHFHHGTADIGALSELPEDLLQSLASEEEYRIPVDKWVFLDTETSGLAGGSGTFAFLTGVGWITDKGFELKQFFMRDHGEEPSLLAALSELLSRFELMVTYNGRAFDAPLLETRYRLARQKVPFGRMKHVDLLHSARRLWRLKLERCRLQDLERHILGVERVGDVDGALIPDLYFQYLRSGDFQPLAPVMKHNAIDILSLACMTAIVPVAFREPERLKSGAEMVALARWFRAEGRLEEAAALMRSALGKAMKEELVWETLWHVSELERKLGRTAEAVSAWTELAGVKNPYQGQAYERLGLHYEKVEKNYARALEMGRAALALDPGEVLEKRVVRLEKRVFAPKSGRLL